jgi:hypothetical protein
MPHRTPSRGSIVAILALAGAVLGADTWSQGIPFPPEPDPAVTEFQFARLVYSGVFNFGRPRWLTDWPEAEQHLLGGIHRLTRVRVGAEGTHVAIMDDKLFDYPWIYAVEVGHWMLDDQEAARLREYLLRGGFLMVDDFHGTSEWAQFVASMQRVFPDRPIVDIPVDDPVFHAVYDMVDRVQIPGIVSLSSGVTYEKDGYDPEWRGIYDDQNRLMVVINFNMDLGDGWEHADVPEYSLKYTTRAYQYAINYIVYAMTH